MWESCNISKKLCNTYYFRDAQLCKIIIHFKKQNEKNIPFKDN